MFSSAEKIKEVFRDFSKLRALIVGDVMIDSYLKGRVERISPEAPVPVVELQNREDMLGGAANVARNIKSLGAEPILCSVIGDDLQGEEFLKLLNREGIHGNGILKSHGRITTTKYRILGNRIQMLRVDHETTSDLNQEEESLLIESIGEMIRTQQPDVIIFQDYNKGVLTRWVIESVINLALQSGIPTVVDPKKKNFTTYSHITLFKPNLKEIREGLKLEVDPKSEASLNVAALQLHQSQHADNVMITLSEEGVFISQVNGNQSGSTILPAHVRAIADVSGAGDTVVSVAALCLALKLSIRETAWLANLAGGLVCEHVGVVAVDKATLLKEAVQLSSAIK